VWGDITLLQDRPDYKWLRNEIGACRKSGVRLSRNNGSLDLLALQFARPWAEAPEGLQERLELLLPHVAKVVEISRKFTLLRQRYQAALAALDQVRIGTCVVARTGEVILASAEAQRIFALDDGIGASKAGFLTCSGQAATALLTAKIRSIAATARGDNSEHEFLTFAERRSGGRPFLIEVAPLRDSVGELEEGLEGAIVFIIDPHNQQVISTRRLSALFALTDAEADICRHMVGGLSAAEIAEVRGVSEETVKSQFKTVYAKTGVRRRADLVRLALAVDPPIGPA
jgi:DNA-binding CsgD family transcriptional regulator